MKFPTVINLEEEGHVNPFEAEHNAQNQNTRNSEEDKMKGKIKVFIDHDDRRVNLFQLATAKVISEIFKNYFTFNLAYSSDKQEITKKMKIDPECRFPEIYCFIGKLQSEQGVEANLRLDTLRMDMTRFTFNYHNILTFLFELNQDSRADLENPYQYLSKEDQAQHKKYDALDSDKDVVLMTSVQKFLRDRMPFNWKGYENYDMSFRNVGGSTKNKGKSADGSRVTLDKKVKDEIRKEEL